MTDGQYKRLILAVITVLITLLVAVGLLIFIINKPRDVVIRNYIGEKGDSGQSIVGPQGPAGESIVGPQGPAGETVINNFTTNIPVPGPQGERGPASPQIKVRVTKTTCLLQSQYEGDDLWTTLAKLPKPCEVGNGQ
jgi:hypothetical protein